MSKKECGVLFDLDGTLVDTSLDLIKSIDMSLGNYGLPLCNRKLVEPYISDGMFEMVKAAVGDLENLQVDIHRLHLQSLKNYKKINGAHSVLFDGIKATIDWLEDRNIPFGIVTNKQSKYSLPLVRSLGLDIYIKSLVSGDTCLNPKPSAEPMLLAAKELNIDPQNIFFLGDAATDVVAAKNSDMISIAVSWGFHKSAEDVNDWGASYVINHPEQLIDIISN